MIPNLFNSIRRKSALVLFSLFLQAITSPSYSQTFTSIVYANSGLNQTDPDVFSSQPVIQGLTHNTLSEIPYGIEAIPYPDPVNGGYSYTNIPISQPGFDGTSVSLGAKLTMVEVDYQNGSVGYNSYFATNAYSIGYTFNPGYWYHITVTYAGSKSNDFTGIGLNLGASQLTSQLSNTGSAMTSIYGTSSDGVTFDDSYLGNTFYSNIVPVSNNQAFTDLAIPAFTVEAATTGLNIEALPSPNHTLTYLKIKSITIVGVPFINLNTAPVCSSQTYSINSSWPVSWSVSPAGIANLTPAGNSVTMSATGNGYATLTASLTAPDGNAYQVNSQAIQVGNPPITITSSRTVGEAFLATATQVSGATYTWYLDGSEEIGQTGHTCTAVVDCGVRNMIYAVATTACGTSQTPQVLILVNCGGGGQQSAARDTLVGKSAVNPLITSPQSPGDLKTNQSTSVFILSPNPTQGIVRISNSKQAYNQRKIYNVRVIDFQGKIRRSVEYAGGIDELSVNLSTLENGAYTIQVFDGRNWNSQHILLLRP